MIGESVDMDKVQKKILDIFHNNYIQSRLSRQIELGEGYETDVAAAGSEE